MALQVWLPLNKNEIKNQGYENPAITIAGTLTYADGKLGKCLTLQGSNSIYVKIPYTNIGTEMSVCCWVKANSPGNWSDIFSFGNNNRVEKGTSTQYYYYAESNSLITSGTTLFTMNDAVWTHIAMTVDGTNVKFYINGTLFGTYSQTNILSAAFGNNKFFILGLRTNLSTPYKGYMNDFRIYNHALSAKEVKEISKGLILHYKLDGNDIGITIPRNGGLIPDGVELYDYILSNGTLYIDTGWIPDYTMSFEVTSKYNASSTGIRGCILSSFNAANALSLEVTSASRYWLHRGNIDNSITITMGADHTSIFSYGGGTWKHQVDGGTANTGSASYSDSVAGSAWMFCDRAKRTTTFNKIFKMYYLSIKENGVLIKNFLPCTYLGEPGMWDTVENKFYRNQGTGLFTLGNKITLKEYEYLQGDGNAYIDTGWVATNGMKVLMLCMWRSNSGDLVIIGSHNTPTNGGSTNGYNRNHFYNRSGTFVLNINNSLNSVGSCQLNTIYNIEYSTAKNLGTYAIINNSIKNVPNSSMTLSPVNNVVVLLNLWASTVSDARIYYIKLFNYLNNLIKDFIPVSYNGTPGLWDKVEWKFYANAGSGSFTLGPEKTVQQDAPIFYDSSGYCNHGSITGTLTTNNDSPRYTKSTRFSNLNCKITCVNEVNLQKEFSLSCWFKLNSIPSNEVTIMNLYRGGAEGRVLINKLTNLDHICLWVGGGSNSSSAQINSTTVLATNTWYHVVGTKDKNNRLHIFINGEELNTGTTATQSYGGATCNPSVGALNPTSNYNCDYYITDARIYCTALSEDDVKELYNTSAFVTNNGVFSEYELYEDNLSDVKKRGLLETANFYENGAESGYALDTDKTRVASNYIISEDFIEI